jgi:DNA-binding transcriptional ArsR family regulator
MNSAPYHKCFETLANELRIQIITHLSEKPLSVQQLAAQLNAEQSRVSHALKMLKECNYVDAAVKGKERIYTLKAGVHDGIHEVQSPKNALGFADSHFNHACNCNCTKIKIENT